MNPVILFGNGAYASMVRVYLDQDSQFEVVGFTVDRNYVGTGQLEGLPVVAFDEVEQLYPPDSVSMLLPLGFNTINGLRRDRYMQAMAKGYTMAGYVSSKAMVWTASDAADNVLIFDGAVIQPFCRIGHNVIINSCACLSHHCVVEDHVFIASGAMLGGGVRVQKQAFIGLGVVIREGVTIAARSFIGAGAVVVGDTEPDAVYVGNPARKIAPTSLEITAASIKSA